MRELQGKVIVVTGASSGTGRAIATELARYGPTLILAARRERALQEVAEECMALGASVHVESADTRHAADHERLARSAFEYGGSIDVWINNAGVLAAGELDQVPAEINENLIRTNLIGYMHGAQQAVTYFKRQNHGLIINNISVGGWFPTPYASAYSASKFGLRGFFEALRGELNAYPDIHVIDLYPGFLDTPGIQHAANYTGKVIRAAPPVYDPRKVARKVMSLIRNPNRSRVTIGASSSVLRIAYAVFPAITRNLTAFFIRRYLQQADPIEKTSGNVLGPVDFGTGIDGSSRSGPVSDNTRIAIAMIAGLVAGLFLTVRRK